MGGTLSLQHTRRRCRCPNRYRWRCIVRQWIDILQARTVALVQRHDHWDATLLPAKDVFQMVTKGSKDWVAWDLDDRRMFPRGRSNNRHLANLVFNGARCLDMWVDGTAVRMNGKTTTLMKNWRCKNSIHP